MKWAEKAERQKGRKAEGQKRQKSEYSVDPAPELVREAEGTSFSALGGFGD